MRSAPDSAPCTVCHSSPSAVTGVKKRCRSSSERGQRADRDAERGERLARARPQQEGDGAVGHQTRSRAGRRTNRSVARFEAVQRAAEHPPEAGDEAASRLKAWMTSTPRSVSCRCVFIAPTAIRGWRAPLRGCGPGRSAERRSRAEARHRRHQRQHGAQDDHRRRRSSPAARDSPPATATPRREHRVERLDVRRAAADGVAERRAVEVTPAGSC